MVLDDAQFISFLKGKRVKLTLKTSSYFGVVLRINSNKTLVLADVSGSNGCKYPGTKLFFGREIVNVEFANEENDDRKITQDMPEKHLDVEKFQPYRKLMTLGGFPFPDDDEDEAECINFVVIDEIHEKFGPAVMHIKKQHVIGVGGEGVELFKNGRLCWLMIATKNKVYLFDILLLGALAFKNGLSMILETKHILKVIHDCRAIAGSLAAQFKVKLTNVFDTQVADAMCFYTKTGGFLPDRVSTLPEVVSLHLKVPSSRLSSLHVRSKLTKEEMDMWYKRPCPVPLLKVMTLSVIHLKPLRLVLLDTLMTDYMILVDSYLKSNLDKPDGLEHVTMENVLELPKELRKLDEMRRERQEWACNRYPVTERGLLARFNPYPKSQTTPDADGHSGTQPDSLEAGTPAPHPSPKVDKNTSLTTRLDKESNQMQAHVMGRGMLLGKEQSSVPSFLSSGRGFLLQKAQSQIPEEGAGGMKRQEMALRANSPTLTKPGSNNDESPKNTCDLGEHPSPPYPSISSLIQSFRSFRN
ncbi:piRNA biogenesis protein EXD1 isoform X1 [Poecilia latipinna]|uniref:piRNA biogenesis protein EXD1 isoform X1 n=1 Tax=Poecilia latipinna TaxID=48699 RepID=UPI00072ED904|nr:PREDICTED: exonuclease 3'-5' domain-containing protein 1 isoform X1 [Poecilia latipinna]